MYTDEFPVSPELNELLAKYKNAWAALPEVTAMWREFEGVGGLLGGMILGGGTGDIFGPMGREGDYGVAALEEEDGDYEAVMMFFAGKLAMGVMCGTAPRDYPLSAFSIRLVASIAREFVGNFDEILRLARKLKEDGCLCFSDVEGWTRSDESAGGDSSRAVAGVPQANGAGDAAVWTHCESRGGEPSK
jgi:hypothetical protein